MKRIVTIQDISCLGKCSITVALPVISAMGVECAILPTAVLSTHTGGFTGFTYRDLTEDMIPILEHWKSLGLQFDAIYTGFLGSFEQIDIVCKCLGILLQTLHVFDHILHPLFQARCPLAAHELVITGFHRFVALHRYDQQHDHHDKKDKYDKKEPADIQSAQPHCIKQSACPCGRHFRS